MNSGIYALINSINGKLYVGQASNFIVRKRGHLAELRHNRHGNRYLQRAFNKYGEQNFKFKILEEVEPIKEKLIEREQYYLDLYKSYVPKNGYNINPTAESNLGRKVSKKSRQLMSIAKKGKPSNRKGKKGKPMSRELKLRLRLLRTPIAIEKWKKSVISGKGFGHGGKKIKIIVSDLIDFYKPGITTLKECTNKFKICSPTVKKILEKNNVKIVKRSPTGKNNPFFGKKHSFHVRQLISKIHKGKIISENRRKQLRVEMKGNQFARKYKQINIV